MAWQPCGALKTHDNFFFRLQRDVLIEGIFWQCSLFATICPLKRYAQQH